MWQHFKPIVGCFKSLLSHRDSEGGEHAQELSFCIVVPDSARKGHRETWGNSFEKIQRSRDSPCTWWDNTFTYLNIQLHIDIQNYILNTLLLSGQRPLQKHWVLKLVKVGFVADFFILLVNFRCEELDLKLLQIPRWTLQFAWMNCYICQCFTRPIGELAFFFGRHNWPLNFVRWVLPSLPYRRREKTFSTKKQLQNWFGLLVARP